MSDFSLIEWTHYTGGPYLGCTMVSPGCLHCYAMELALSRLERVFRAAYRKAGFIDWQTRPVWGDQATRVLTKGFWTDVPRYDRAAAKANERRRIFPSLIDWLDDMPGGIIDQDGAALNPINVLGDFLTVVYASQNLDWQLLTKRPENWRRLLEQVGFLWGHGAEPLAGAYAWLMDWLGANGPAKPPANVWVGTSVEDQTRAELRIPLLIAIPARVRFLSCEPLLGPVDLGIRVPGLGMDAGFAPGIHWVICGGESGPQARPMNPAWARSLRDQCNAAGVAFFFKQWGEFVDNANMPAATVCPEDCSFRTFSDQTVWRVGKKDAGRSLDGREWNEFPEVTA